MAGSILARRLRRAAPLCALSGFAVLALALGQGVAIAKPAHHSGVSYYVVKSAKAKCKAHYTKQTVTLRVRRHHRWVHVHQVRCVYTGTRSSGGGGVPSFPVNLPTAGVTVTAIPTAVADEYWTSANQALIVGAGAGVLANDSGLGLGAQLVSGAAHGTVTLDRSGAFHYTPTSGYSGIDHFSYHATDATGESSGAARVTVNVAPVAAAPGSYDVGSGATLNVGAPGLLAGAIGSGLSAELVTSPSHGNVTVNADGSFSYTPNGAFAGADSFEFDVVDADGQTSAPVTVAVEVGAAPPSTVAETFTGAVGNTELQAGGTRGGGPEVYESGANALAGDSDPSGGTLSTTPASITTAQGGSVTLAADGTFTYQPPVGFDGPSDSFTYQVDSSEGLSAQASATIDFGGSRVWYVNASASAGGDGSSWAPFDTLASVSSPGGAAASGDVVFLFPGSYGGGIALAANETLLGAPAGLTVGSENLLAASGSNPVITNASAGGAGVSLADGDNVSAVTVSGATGNGITAANVDNFAISSNVTVSGAGADGIDVSGGGGDAQIAAAIGGSAGHAVDVQSRSSGTLTFSGSVDDTGTGVLLSGNTGAKINFTGTLTADTTNSHPAFEATGGGTVTATATDNTLSATGTAAPAALDVDSTAIGTAGLDFQSISAGSSPSSGPTDGVILSNTGSGPLHVTGSNNDAGSGGTIQGTQTAALDVSSTGPISLDDMLVEPAAGDGVLASVVPSLTVLNSTITGGATAIAASGDASTQQTPQTFNLQNNVLSAQQDAAIALTYSGDTTGYVELNHIGSESPVLVGSTTGDGIDISPTGGGTTAAQITGNQIERILAGNGIDAQAQANTTLDLTLTNNTIQTDGNGSLDGVLVGSAGSVCLDTFGNTITVNGSSSNANALEVEQLSTQSVFEIQGYDGVPSHLVTDLEAGENLTLNGPGNLVVATPDGPTGFTSAPGTPSACPQPSSSSGGV
jgi:hypothetical protein